MRNPGTQAEKIIYEHLLTQATPTSVTRPAMGIARLLLPEGRSSACSRQVCNIPKSRAMFMLMIDAIRSKL